MQIVNPIYDAAFKYLMDDLESARILISALMGRTVVQLTPMPTEHAINEEKRGLTVYRMDFSATVQMEDGKRTQVIIEVQKAKFPADIMRFRRYVGEQYSNKAHYTLDKKGAKLPLPIYSVYFLGYSIAKTHFPVIKMERHCFNPSTGERLETLPEFFEGLTHASMAVQVSELKEPYKGRLEEMLSIFDQHRQFRDTHVLSMDEDSYPPEAAALLRRLSRAVSEPEVRAHMDLEDEILEELDNLDRKVEEQREQLEEKDKALEKKDKALEETHKALEEKDKALEERDRAAAEQQRLIDDLRRKLVERT